MGKTLQKCSLGVLSLWLLSGCASPDATIPDQGGTQKPSVLDAGLPTDFDSNRSNEPESGFAVAATRIRSCTVPADSLSPFGDTLSAAVAPLDSGDILLEVGAGDTPPSASVIKLLTAAAALKALGPDFRFQTQVIRGEGPGEIFLVGGGDVTLTRSPHSNYYDSSASLQGLVTKMPPLLSPEHAEEFIVRPDVTRYANYQEWSSAWRAGSERLGYVAPVSALQVDGDRDVPWNRLSPRSQNPADRAVGWFIDEMQVRGFEGVRPGPPGKAPPEGESLAIEYSAPLTDLLEVMLQDSDNSLAEVIAREVALADGSSNIGASIKKWSGVDYELLKNSEAQGGSGLNPDTRITHRAILDLLQKIDREPELEPMRKSLPVSGLSGSLRNRFTEHSESGDFVEAKTGTLLNTRSLAGYAKSDDGEALVFSVNATGVGVGPGTVRDIDRLVAEIARCGENLASVVPGSSAGRD